MKADHVVTIEAADCAFHAVQNCATPSTIFLHGFSGDLHGWDGACSALNGALPTLRYDLRGFGNTFDRTEKPFSHTSDLLAILDTISSRSVNLVGLSMGGAIALNFALDHPDRVNRLVLISPGMVAWEWSAAWIAQWRAITAKARAGEMAQARELWWLHPLFATTRGSDSALDLRASIMRYSGQQWIHDRQLSALPDVDRLHTLQAPTLLLTGGRDLDDFRLIADVIAAGVPQLARVEFPENGHMLPLENPDVCAEQIRIFLANSAST